MKVVMNRMAPSVVGDFSGACVAIGFERTPLLSFTEFIILHP